MSRVDPAVAASGIRTMGDIVSSSAAEHRFQAFLLTVFGGMALFLSLVGLYGLLTYSVQQRTAEIGIRMALGAQQNSILRLVLRQGFYLVLAGLALGLIAAVALTGLLASLLFEIQPADPITYLAVAVLFTAVALAACYIPARRATRIDPISALRYE